MEDKFEFDFMEIVNIEFCVKTTINTYNKQIEKDPIQYVGLISVVENLTKISNKCEKYIVDFLKLKP